MNKIKTNKKVTIYLLIVMKLIKIRKEVQNLLIYQITLIIYNINKGISP